MEVFSLYLIVLSLNLLSVSSSSCSNPLFRVETWPIDSLDRPPYLSSPKSIEENSFRYCYEQAGTSSCCSSDTLVFIKDSIQSYSDYLSSQSTSFIGRIRDTFNDFDPEVQRYKESGRLLADFPSVDGSELEYSLPQGRGIERDRPGLLIITAAEQESIQKPVREMNAHMKYYAEKAAGCMKAMVTHLAGVMCMGCNSEWEEYVQEENFREVTFLLHQTTCEYVGEECLEYVELYQQVPEIAQGYADEIKNVLDSSIDRNRIRYSEVEYNDLYDLFIEEPQPGCTTEESCKEYICEDMLNSLNGFTSSASSFTDPFNYSSRRLSVTNSVEYRFISYGFNSIFSGENSGIYLEVSVDGESTYIMEEDSSLILYISLALSLLLI